MTKDTRPKTAQQIIRNLHNFNRKERDHLMKFALSDSPSHPQISKGLWRAIRPPEGKRQRPDPTEMFVGMDYHLNWLYAAVVLSDEYEPDGIGNQANKWPDSVHANVPIQGNQEDVDLLIAFQHGDKALHLCLIEAKFDTGWGSEQFLSKARRLDAIKSVTDSNKNGFEIKWRLILASPSESGPTKEAFTPSSLNNLSDWITEGSGNDTTVPYFKFGPEHLFHVKREKEDAGSPWEVLPINLRGRNRK